jgi:hypothetical protein
MGRDKRFPDEPRIYDLVVAYDGDPVNVGRIVADASFHHYFNVSLRKLPERDRSGNPVSGSSLDQIGQYYANLALWLAPKSLRDEIKLNLLFRLAEHQDVFEVRGSGPLYLGKVARHALELEFGYSNLCRLFAPSEVKDERQLVDEILGLVYLGRNSFVKLTLEEYEAVLGGIVEAYHNFFRASRVVDLSRLDRKPEPFDMLRRGFALASKSLSTLSEKLSDQYLKADEERPLDEY